INYGKYVLLLIISAYSVSSYQKNEWIRIPLKNTQMEPKIRGTSSSGTAEDLSYIWINPLSEATNNPQLNQIVRYEWKRSDTRERDVQEVLHLGRVIALAGQRVAIKEGNVYVDGTRLTQDYVETKRIGDDYEEIIVPQGSVYLMVDNRNAGELRPGHYLRDSRQLGPIPIYLITGVMKE
ncbi:MAG: signal peptidase I, partial [Planctomycetota bacterium]